MFALGGLWGGLNTSWKISNKSLGVVLPRGCS